jgi:hypothetical protein
MEQDKLFQLIRKLVEKTKQGHARWERTVDVGVYQLALPGNSILISKRGKDSASNPEYVVSIYDSQGELIEETTPSDLSKLGGPWTVALGSYRQALELFAELYEGARRTAMNMDKAIDGILADLDRLSP